MVLATTIWRSESAPEIHTEVVLFEVKGNSQDIQVKQVVRETPRTAKPKSKSVAMKAEPVPAEAPDQVENSQQPTAQTGTESTAEGGSENEIFGTEQGVEVSAQERYRIELQAMLEKKKQYPLLAKRLRQQGKVLVRFTLKRDGTVSAAEVIGNSEFETLNKAAKELISQISGLKPFPEEVKKNQWVFVLPVEYRI